MVTLEPRYNIPSRQYDRSCSPQVVLHCIVLQALYRDVYRMPIDTPRLT